MESSRLSIEQAEMNRRFPQFSLRELRTGQIAWDGTVSTNNYRIVAVYPADYPYSAPKIYPVNSVRDNTPHRFKDGSICTHLPAEWNSNCTVLTAIGWAAAWFHAYDKWRTTGRWPGKKHDE